jgi:hypothetical protein
MAGEAQTAAVLANEVVQHTRFVMTVDEVLPICELVVAGCRVAAQNGIYQTHPEVSEIAEVCEDLATRNTRKGYGGYVPFVPIIDNLFGGRGITCGECFGYDYRDTTRSYRRDIGAVLPEGHSERLSELQSNASDPDLARARLQALRDLGVVYKS